MTDRPILFSGPMVQALLDGRKTQTRRVLKPQPRSAPIRHDGVWTDCGGYEDGPYGGPLRTDVRPIKMPWSVGDRLWVREAHYLTDDGEEDYPVYAADTESVEMHLDDMENFKRVLEEKLYKRHIRLRPSIHMPRWASRLTLTVTDVRVQRVQEISEGDAIAEGTPHISVADIPRSAAWSNRQDFANLWNILNASRGYGWDENPWVSATTFTVHHCNIDQMECAA